VVPYAVWGPSTSFGWRLTSLIQDDSINLKGRKNARLVGQAVLAFSTRIRKLADVFVERFLDLFFRYVAYDLLLHLAVFENQQGGDAADTVAHRGG